MAHNDLRHIIGGGGASWWRERELDAATRRGTVDHEQTPALQADPELESTHYDRGCKDFSEVEGQPRSSAQTRHRHPGKTLAQIFSKDNRESNH